MTKNFVSNLTNGVQLELNDICFGEPETFDPEPYFRQLSYINRWAGNLHREYSVLHHSLLVAEAINELPLRIYGLLHDIPECATGDVTGPYKAFVDQMTGGMVEAHETQMLNKVCEAVGVAPVNLTIGRKLYKADMVARATELRDVVANPKGIEINFEPLPKTIQFVPREELIIQALDAYYIYLDWHKETYVDANNA